MLVSLFVLNFVVGVGIMLVAYNNIINSKKDFITKNISSLAFSLSEQIKPALEFDDRATAEEIIDGILSLPDSEFIGVWKVDPFNSKDAKLNTTDLRNIDYSKSLFFAKDKQKQNNSHDISFSLDEDFINWNANRIDIGRVVYSGEIKSGFLVLSENLNRFLFFKKETTKLLITSLLIHLVTSSLIALWIEKSLTKPLLELVNVAKKISLGKDLKVRARKLSNDEFGELTNVFNEMLESLNNANEELILSKQKVEEKVLERTKELDLANRKLHTEIEEKEIRSNQLLELQNQFAQQERLASVGQVSSNIAHELRNPMAAIRNAVYFLNQNFPENEIVKEKLDLIDQQLSESDEVIKRLLDLTKGKDLEIEPLELQEICKEAIEISNLEEKVVLTFNGTDKKSKIHADKLLFRQILSNLFINSFQAATSLPVKISVFVDLLDPDIEILISDNGHGIDKKFLSKVFDPLFTTKKDGFGVGLSLCKDLLAKHEGEIEVTDSSSKGTTFKITIPRTL